METSSTITGNFFRKVGKRMNLVLFLLSDSKDRNYPKKVKNLAKFARNVSSGARGYTMALKMQFPQLI